MKKLSIVIAAILLIAFLCAALYFSWSAYFQRFPNSSWWSFFFQ